MHHVVLQRSKNRLEVDAEMMEEAFILRINQCSPEYGIDVVIFYRRTVFAEVFSYLYTVGTIQFWRFDGLGVHNAAESRRLSEEPEEVDIYHEQVEYKGYDERGKAYCQSWIPLLALIKVLIPRPEALDGLPASTDDLLHIVRYSSLFPVVGRDETTWRSRRA